MRYYDQMPEERQKEGVLAKPQKEEVDQMVLYEFATLANRLGFQTQQICDLMKQSPDLTIARAAFLKAGKLD
jgi:hypothetical protein